MCVCVCVYIYIYTHTLVSHIWLCDPMDCSAPGSSVHGIFQGRILEWVAVSFSRASSSPRDWTWVSCVEGRFFNNWATREVTKLCSMGTVLFLICFLESVLIAAVLDHLEFSGQTVNWPYIYIYMLTVCVYIYIILPCYTCFSSVCQFASWNSTFSALLLH